MSLPILLTAVCFLSGGVESQKTEVLAAMESFRQAMLHRDGAALERLLSDDLLYTHSAGKFETKAEFMQSIVSGKSVTEKLEFSEITVRVHGNTVLVRTRVDLWHSATDIVHMNVLHVWVKSPGGWKMVARQATRLG